MCNSSLGSEICSMQYSIELPDGVLEMERRSSEEPPARSTAESSLQLVLRFSKEKGLVAEIYCGMQCVHTFARLTCLLGSEALWWESWSSKDGVECEDPCSVPRCLTDQL